MNKLMLAVVAMAMCSVQAAHAGDEKFSALNDFTNVHHDPDGIWKDREMVPMTTGGTVDVYRWGLETPAGSYLLSTAMIAGCSATYCPTRVLFKPKDSEPPRIVVNVEAPLYLQPFLSADGKSIIIGDGIEKFPIK